MKNDYTALDTAILAAISARAGALSFSAMQTGAILDEAQKIADAENTGKMAREKKRAWRVIDRRLQALRKAGRIRYQRQPEGWVLAA